VGYTLSSSVGAAVYDVRVRSLTTKLNAQSTTAFGVFADNRKLPIHRWFPFIEGYSSNLVQYALTNASDTSSVFDPFGGSGTTGLTAALSGLNSTFTEANPYMAWVADVKINQVRAAAQDPDAHQSLAAVTSDLRSFVSASALDDHPILTVDRQRDFFPPGVALAIIQSLDAIEKQLNGATRQLARLAVATSIVPSSNMIRRTDLRRRRANESPPNDFWQTLTTALQMITTDVKEVGHSVIGKVEQLSDDARATYKPHAPFTTIITSPPYLNGTNYGRNTKLELLALGFLENERQLDTLRVREITAGINNVTNKLSIPSSFEEVTEVADRVAKVTYDLRIPKMIRSYFSDMSLVLTRLWAESAETAELWLDIGDSKYSGVPVATHTLTEIVAKQAGWELVDDLPLRVRRSYDGSQLVQTLLRFRKGSRA
jgi:hypothetical protein